MSAKTQTVMSEADFQRWELHMMQVQADLHERYLHYDAKVVPAQPGAARRERGERDPTRPRT